MTAELKATTKQVSATHIVHHHLYALDQFLGFSGSSTFHVTSSYRSILPVARDRTSLKICPSMVSPVYSSKLASLLSVRVGRFTTSAPS